MKKFSILIILALVFSVSLTACGKKSSLPQGSLPEESLPSEELKVTDFFPIAPNLYWIYEGIGNEYAGGRVDTEFIGENKVQLSHDTGGTVVAKVFEVTEDGIKLVNAIEESYYRMNYMEEKGQKENYYLKAPLKAGTGWQEGDTAWTIESMEEKVKVPAGEFVCVKAVGKSKEANLERYFAKGVGLVKEKFISGSMTVESNLLKFGDAEKDKSLPVKTLAVYYPSGNIDKLLKDQVKEEFKTGEGLANRITEILKRDKYKVLSKNTRLLDMKREGQNLRLNFSKELISEMNAGSAYEALIIDSIVNTYGHNFGAEGVVINVDGRGYESGHFAFGQDEVLSVKF